MIAAEVVVVDRKRLLNRSIIRCSSLRSVQSDKGSNGGTVRLTSFILAVVALTGSLPAYGHHSFAAYYFEDQSVSIEGDLVEFEYRAPHASLRLTALDAQGQMQTYEVEWANPNRLSRDGITRDTLKAGDRVVITGSPGRTASEYKLHVKQIERPLDGWSWRAGRRR